MEGELVELEEGASGLALKDQLEHEDIGEQMSRVEARKCGKQLFRQYQLAKTHAILWAAELARSYRGQAHLAEGEPDWSQWAARQCPGLTAANARQLVRQGHIVLMLERSERISTKVDLRSWSKLDYPGATALRRLATFRSKHGTPRMLKVYDEAVSVRGTGNITDDDVRKAESKFVKPLRQNGGQEEEEEREIDPAFLEQLTRRKALGSGEEEPELPNELSEAVLGALDRFGVCTGMFADLRARIATPGISADAVFMELRELLDEVEQLKAAVFQAFGPSGDDDDEGDEDGGER